MLIRSLLAGLLRMSSSPRSITAASGRMLFSMSLTTATMVCGMLSLLLMSRMDFPTALLLPNILRA